MIQVSGLTMCHRRRAAPVLDDVSFTAAPGRVTGLLGPSGAGKTVAVRLMMGLEPGRGVALFDGLPYARLRRPAREVGVLLGGPACPAGLRARNHVRLLATALGVPRDRADEVIELVGLAHVAERRPRDFSPGMGRRLALAAVLLGDPHTVVLDDPAAGLDPPAAAWLRSFLKALAAQGRVVLVTGRDPGEMTTLADRIVVLDAGRLVADEPVAEYRRNRMRREVVVRTPHARRLARLLASEGGEVLHCSVGRIVLAGLEPTDIGETAFRNGMPVHELADRVVDRTPARAGAGDPDTVPPGRIRPGDLTAGSALYRADGGPAPEPGLPHVDTAPTAVAAGSGFGAPETGPGAEPPWVMHTPWTGDPASWSAPSGRHRAGPPSAGRGGRTPTGRRPAAPSHPDAETTVSTPVAHHASEAVTEPLPAISDHTLPLPGVAADDLPPRTAPRPDGARLREPSPEPPQQARTPTAPAPRSHGHPYPGARPAHPGDPVSGAAGRSAASRPAETPDGPRTVRDRSGAEPPDDRLRPNGRPPYTGARPVAETEEAHR